MAVLAAYELIIKIHEKKMALWNVPCLCGSEIAEQ